MQNLEQSQQIKRNEVINEIVKLYKLTFPCPHCQKEINDNHFDQATKIINEQIRIIVEKHFLFQETSYQQLWQKKMLELKSYENLSPVRDLIRTITEQKEKIGHLQSSEYIEKLERVRRLEETNNELRNQLQLLQVRDRASKRKGEDFEQYILEELNRVFDDKDKINKITQMGTKADFLQEVLTENEPKKTTGRIIYEAKDTEKWDDKWVNKLENDMASLKADFGIIIATCENGKPFRCLDPRKKIYVSDENNFIYIAKIMRDSLIQKHHLLEIVNADSKEKRIKRFEEWINNRLPQFLARLEKELIDLNKNSNSISRAAESLKSLEANIRKIVLEEVRTELSNL